MTDWIPLHEDRIDRWLQRYDDGTKKKRNKFASLLIISVIVDVITKTKQKQQSEKTAVSGESAGARTAKQ